MEWKKHVRNQDGQPCTVEQLIALYDWTQETADSKNLTAEETGVLYLDDTQLTVLHLSTILKPDGTEPSTTVKNNIQTSYAALLTEHGLEAFASDAELPIPVPPVPPVETFDAAAPAPAADS